MLCTISIIAINAFTNIEAYFLVVIYKRKVFAFQVVYLCLNIMLLQLLYY